MSMLKQVDERVDYETMVMNSSGCSCEATCSFLCFLLVLPMMRWLRANGVSSEFRCQSIVRKVTSGLLEQRRKKRLTKQCYAVFSPPFSFGFTTTLVVRNEGLIKQNHKIQILTYSIIMRRQHQQHYYVSDKKDSPTMSPLRSPSRYRSYETSEEYQILFHLPLQVQQRLNSSRQEDPLNSSSSSGDCPISVFCFSQGYVLNVEIEDLEDGSLLFSRNLFLKDDARQEGIYSEIIGRNNHYYLRVVVPKLSSHEQQPTKQEQPPELKTRLYDATLSPLRGTKKLSKWVKKGLKQTSMLLLDLDQRLYPAYYNDNDDDDKTSRSI